MLQAASTSGHLSFDAQDAARLAMPFVTAICAAVSLLGLGGQLEKVKRHGAREVMCASCVRASGWLGGCSLAFGLDTYFCDGRNCLRGPFDYHGAILESVHGHHSPSIVDGKFVTRFTGVDSRVCSSAR